jgi:hypothetical protein
MRKYKAYMQYIYAGPSVFAPYGPTYTLELLGLSAVVLTYVKRCFRSFNIPIGLIAL